MAKSLSTSAASVAERSESASAGSAGPKQPRSLLGKFWAGKLDFDFITVRRRWYIVSAALLTACVLVLIVRGLNLGIDFTGGASFTVPATNPQAAISEVRTAVDSTGLVDPNEVTVQTVGESVRAQMPLLTEETPVVRDAIAAQLGIESDAVASSVIGASWGEQVTDRAVIALLIFLALVLAMIALYFRDWKYSIAATIALLHDLVITVGIYAAVGFTVSPTSVIGVLTILGYSIYDTVVVFDKLRENTANNPRNTYAENANNAINQVLIRSLNTTVIGVLPVAALLFAGSVLLGSGPLADVGLALFVGMLAGAFSSLFIATPLVVDLKRREPEVAKHDAKVLKKRAEAARGQQDSAELGEPADSGTTVAESLGAEDAGIPVVTVDRATAERFTGPRDSSNAGRSQPRKQTRSERKSR